ncbi:MAG TPA: hypothetical protein VLM89_12665 [Phycisphaerae bacterium]|nr:hypothetical protein [Phycisphaerae bacterium]
MRVSFYAEYVRIDAAGRAYVPLPVSSVPAATASKTANVAASGVYVLLTGVTPKADTKWAT